jgi:sialic acid synthase SpsE
MLNLKNQIKPYIIAEIGTNHDGNLKQAKKLVYHAKKVGCDCVKFQSWDETMWSDSFLKKNKKLLKLIRRLSIDFFFLKKIKEYCTKINIDFASTPFSSNQLEELIKLKPAFVKVASMDLNNTPFLEKCADQKYPVIISTGLASIDEILKAQNIFFKKKKTNVLFMHCISMYPPGFSNLNLNNILYLKKKLKFPIGFSDHSLGFVAPIQAITMGIKFIEKHFTLNRNQKGPDHKFAADLVEMKKIVLYANQSYKSLGTFERVISKNEVELRKIFRRSAYAIRDLNKGHVLKKQDVIYQRPAIGLDPHKISLILGKKLKKNIKKAQLIERAFFT